MTKRTFSLALALTLGVGLVAWPQADRVGAQAPDPEPQAELDSPHTFQGRVRISVDGPELHGLGLPHLIGAPVHHDLFALVAEALGISREDLVAEKEAGKSLDEIAQAHGTTKAALLEKVEVAMRDRLETHLDEAVADGKLSREAADKMLEGFKVELDLDDLPLKAAGMLHVGPLGAMGTMGGMGFMKRLDPEDGTFEMFIGPEEDVLLAGEALPAVKARPFRPFEPLDTATFGALEQVIKDAVAAGRLTQDQADQALERLDPAKAMVPAVRVIKRAPGTGTTAPSVAPARPAEARPL
jgi:hypothetical protein